MPDVEESISLDIKGAAMDAGKIAGVVAGTIAPIVASAVKSIGRFLADMPIIASVIKIFKLILTLLLLPLIPILKPMIIALSNFAKTLAPIMQKAMEDISAAMPGVIETISGMITAMTPIFAFLGKTLGDLFAGITTGDWSALLEDVSVIFTSIIDWVLNTGLPMLGTFISDVLVPALGTSFGNFINMFTGGKIIEFLTTNGPAILSTAFTMLGGLVVAIMVTAWTIIGGFIKGIWKNYLEKPWSDLKKNVTDIWNNVIKPIGDTISSVLNSVITAIIGFIRSIPGGGAVLRALGMQTGGYVQNTGMAMLHAGERVLSAGERRGGEVRSANFTINVNNPSVRSDADIKALVKQINKAQQENLRRYTSYV